MTTSPAPIPQTETASQLLNKKLTSHFPVVRRSLRQSLSSKMCPRLLADAVMPSEEVVSKLKPQGTKISYKMTNLITKIVTNLSLDHVP